MYTSSSLLFSFSTFFFFRWLIKHIRSIFHSLTYEKFLFDHHHHHSWIYEGSSLRSISNLFGLFLCFHFIRSRHVWILIGQLLSLCKMFICQCDPLCLLTTMIIIIAKWYSFIFFLSFWNRYKKKMAKKTWFFYFDHQKCGLSTIKRKKKKQIRDNNNNNKNSKKSFYLDHKLFSDQVTYDYVCFFCLKPSLNRSDLIIWWWSWLRWWWWNWMCWW